MAQDFPPDNHTMSPGTWGTDALDATDQVFQGVTSIKFPSGGANNAKLESDYIPVDGTMPYMVEMILRASSVAAGCKPYLQAAGYDKDKNLITVGLVYTQVASAANTWTTWKGVIRPGTGVAYLRIIFGKDATVAFDLWVAKWHITRLGRMAKIYRNANVSLASNAAPSKISLDATDYDYGDFADSLNGRLRPNIAQYQDNNHRSMFVLSGQVEVQAMAAGVQLTAQIVYNYNGGQVVIGEQQIFTGGAGTHRLNVTSQPILLEGRDAFAGITSFELWVAQVSGVNKTVTGGQYKTWLSLHEITP